MTTRNASDRRLSELDALRGFAAVAVLLFHLTFYDDRLGLAPFQVPGGHYGVELFFIISGFVIFMTLAGAGSIRAFVVSRVARLYPAYWCAVLVTTAVLLLTSSHPPSPANVAVNLTMLQPFFGMANVDDSYWTLAVELEFYVVIAIVFMVGLIERIDQVCIFFLLAASAFRIVLAWRGVGVPSSAGFGLVEYGSFFTIGICLFRLRAGYRSCSTHTALLLAIAYSAWGGPAASFSPGALSYLGITCGLTFLMWLAVNERAGWLRWPPLVLVGGVSYPLYLVHQRIGSYLIDSLHRHGLPAAFAAAVLVVAILAVAIHVMIEKPCRRLIRQALAGAVTSPGSV